MRISKWLGVVAIVLSLVLAACSAANPGPTTWIDRPLDGDQVGLELVTIQAHASDASGIGKFEFLINESLLSSAAGSGTRFSRAAVEWVPLHPASTSCAFARSTALVPSVPRPGL